MRAARMLLVPRPPPPRTRSVRRASPSRRVAAALGFAGFATTLAVSLRDACSRLAAVRAIVRQYLERYSGEREEHRRLLEFLDSAADWSEAVSRKNPRGHLTASAMVVRRTDGRAVLVHHAALGKLLQPGGHFEPEDASPLAAALREAAEETPLRDFQPVPTGEDPLLPVDIDCHLIPANPAKGEGEHFHFDFRYVLLAEGDVGNVCVLRRLSDFPVPGDLARLAAKTKALLFPPGAPGALRASAR